ncbi:hypothetical protein IE4872_PC00028 (plasmid) [Rhizobium gallicum]|uniref:Uncharacterized protein n=1 Tax=Rhizobium gallicum TaxID=56730 RepID=A0A1L5NQ84_9HYPH|nr:hypothetical protein IE4872_PC00028 [Rhizobium gallicum]
MAQAESWRSLVLAPHGERNRRDETELLRAIEDGRCGLMGDFLVALWVKRRFACSLERPPLKDSSRTVSYPSCISLAVRRDARPTFFRFYAIGRWQLGKAVRWWRFQLYRDQGGAP